MRDVKLSIAETKATIANGAQQLGRIVRPKLRGMVDELTLQRVAGWVILANGNSPAPTVAVRIAGQIVGTGIADKLRMDVKSAGFATEFCGFDIPVDLSPRDIFGDNIEVVVMLDNKKFRDIQVSPDARPWKVGFWSNQNLPPQRWMSLADRVKFDADQLGTRKEQVTALKSLLVEGPLKGDYSIAIVNREFAKSVLSSTNMLTLTSDDKGLEDDAFFNAEKRLVERYDERVDTSEFDVHSVNTWPPETSHMRARFNTLHCYAWEESSFPPQFLDGFNKHLDLICATSMFTKVALENSGLTVPVVVTGNGIDPSLFNLSRRRRSRGQRFRFLHISSCFARKAADVLVRAFVEEFEHDDVELHIKTFDNPHNNIREIISSYGEKARNITTSFANLPTAAVRKLYLTSDCLVAASRGEGFLLPAAEAMAIGLPVITTDAGGQADFCDNTTAWLVKSTAVPSYTHMNLNGSYWYEPDILSLRHQMRAVFRASEAEKDIKAVPAKQLISNTYRWEKVANRYLAAVSNLRSAERPRRRLAIVSTWNQSCGIATYSQELYPKLVDEYDIVVFTEHTSDIIGTDEDFVVRSWSRRRDNMAPLADRIIDGGFDAVLIQHHPSHFSWADLSLLIDCVVQGSASGIKIFCQLHSTSGQHVDIQARRLSLARVDAFLVHTISDVEVLGPIAADTRVAVIPHGVPVLALDKIKRAENSTFHVGSFGFCMPHKGIKNHIRSLAIVREKIPNLQVTLLHAVNDDEKTIKYAVEVMSLIHEFELDDVVTIDFRFLDKKVVGERLSTCDLIVLPYDSNLESASGAIRDVLGLSVPILTTDVSTFTDVSDFVFKVPTNHPFDLASEILKLYEDEQFRASKMQKQTDYVHEHSWGVVASRISNIIQSVS